MRSLLLLALSLWAAPVLADEPKSVSVKTIEAAQRAVGPIVCAQDKGGGIWELKKIFGTGFFINREGAFLTAAHVIFGWEQVSKDFGPCFPAIVVPTVPWGGENRTVSRRTVKFFRFSECKYNRDADVAVCTPINNPFADKATRTVSTLRLGSIANHPDGSPVAFTGFPMAFQVPVTSKGYIAAYADFDKRLVIDKSAWPGASGSPVYDWEGKVIGLVIETGTALGAGLTYARPVDLIVEFLSNEKIAFQK